ncbi:MAG: hypothetical protein Fur0044_31000 [Anaerolineae bacterium]
MMRKKSRITYHASPTKFFSRDKTKIIAIGRLTSQQGKFRIGPNQGDKFYRSIEGRNKL